MTRDRSSRRAILVVAGVMMVAAALGARPALAQPRNVHVLFTQQDTVQAFDSLSGKGYQIGTATGQISGTTFVDFQFAPAGPANGDALPITFTNKVTVTDLDGDQLFFDNDGAGTFHLGIAGSEFKGLGGPLTGTYVVTGGTGKFADWQIGKTFTYRAIVTYTVPPAGALGTVFVEISYHDRGRR